MLVNVLVSREGLTVFARLGDWGVLGQVNLTVEAVVYGLVLALRLLVVTLACLLIVCAANPDELLARVPAHLAALGSDGRSDDAADPRPGRGRPAPGGGAALQA